MRPWRGSVRYATYTISPHCSQPALLVCRCNLNKHYLQRKLHTTLALLHRNQRFARPAICVFTQNMLHKLRPGSVGAWPPKTATASLCTHTRTHRDHRASTPGLLNTCVSLCAASAMLSSRLLHALRLRKQRVQPG